MRNPEKFEPGFKKESPQPEERKEEEEREAEKRIEKFENSGNQIEVHFTGEKEYDAQEKETFWKIEEIEIISPEGQRIKLSSLLPERWHFEEHRGHSPYFYMATSFSRKSIVIPEFWRKTESRWLREKEPPPTPYQEERKGRIVRPWGEVIEWEDIPTFNCPEAPLSLLHEIGHAHQRYTRKGGEIRRKMKEKIKQAQEEGKAVSLTRKELESYCQYVLKSERDAWAYALSKYRELKKKGVDILPQAKTNREVLEIVNQELKTYLEKVIHYGEFKELKKELAKRKKGLVKEVLRKIKKFLE